MQESKQTREGLEEILLETLSLSTEEIERGLSKFPGIGNSGPLAHSMHNQGLQ